MSVSCSIEAAPVSKSVVHEPVLVHEVTRLLAPPAGGVVVDATLGDGGHAERLLEAVGPTGRVIGIDRDPSSLARAARRLGRFGDRLLTLRGRHEELCELLRGAGFFTVDACLFDLGLSSAQIEDPRRGFSFRVEGPLDMRMDPEDGAPAADLLAGAPVEELTRILREYGEERRASSIARAIVRRRAERPLETTTDLARLVEGVLGPGARRFRIHPATRTFQALRIAVNREIEGLPALVADAASILRRGGRLAFLSYHSLEDRAIKRGLRALAHRCVCPPDLPLCACGRENWVRIATPRAVRPTTEEIERNPRSRSARLRVAERL